MGKDIVKLIKKDKHIVYGIAWTTDKPIGNIVIATGMEEHSSRYDDFAAFLNRHGYNVYCLDYYGQGQNVLQGNEKIGEVPQSAFRKFVYSLFEMIRKIEISTLPVYVIGHSMGSFHIQDLIQRFGTHIKKAVLIGSNGPDFTVRLGYNLARFTVPKFSYHKPAKLLRLFSIGAYEKSVKNRRTSADWISHREDIVDAYITDELCGHHSSKGFYREMLKGMSRLYQHKFMAKVPHELPILILGGRQDPLSHNGKGLEKLAKLYKKHHVREVELVIFENMRHEILNEVDNYKVYDAVLSFIQK